MGIGQWMRVLDTVGGLVQMSGGSAVRSRGRAAPGGGGPLGQLETRLAGVVVAALKEAFDRDRARMDLERVADRSRTPARRGGAPGRAAASGGGPRARSAPADRGHGVRPVMLSAALGVWLPGMRTVVPRVLLGSGWLLRHRRRSAARSRPGSRSRPGRAGPVRDRRRTRARTSAAAPRHPGCFSASLALSWRACWRLWRLSAVRELSGTHRDPDHVRHCTIRHDYCLRRRLVRGHPPFAAAAAAAARAAPLPQHRRGSRRASSAPRRSTTASGARRRSTSASAGRRWSSRTTTRWRARWSSARC